MQCLTGDVPGCDCDHSEYFELNPLDYRNIWFAWASAKDFLSINQNMSLTLNSIRFCFSIIWLLQVILLSTWKPRYSAFGDCGIWMLFSWTLGHCSFRKMKFTRSDLVSLILILHFFSQFCIWLRCCYCILVSCQDDSIIREGIYDRVFTRRRAWCTEDIK